MDLEEHQRQIDRLLNKDRVTTGNEHLNALVEGIIQEEFTIEDVLAFTTIPMETLVSLIEERKAK